MKHFRLWALVVLSMWMAPVALAVSNNEQVCEGLDSGKVDVVGDHATVTVTAPEGFLIDAYCVKAGSVQQGNGPEYVNVDPPQATVTFGHSSGKDVSHWSVSYTPIPSESPSPTPDPDPSPTPEPPVDEPPVDEPPVEEPPVVEDNDPPGKGINPFDVNTGPREDAILLGLVALLLALMGGWAIWWTRRQRRDHSAW